jgi:hypothetical protein
MTRKLHAVRGRGATAAAPLGAAALVLLAGCGSSSTTPAAPATPAPTVAPTPGPSPSALTCNPTPPAIYGMRVTIRDASGYRKILGAVPLVANYDGYCGKVGFDPNQWYCTTRTDDDPARAACDAVAVGRSGDTGRWGPTWYWEGQPCAQTGDQQGCENFPTDQFQAYAKGSGEYAACAAPEIEMEPEGGSRCGVIEIP